MSLVDIDSWLIEYESCKRLRLTILTQLRLREKRQRLSAVYNRLTASIQLNINQLETELQQLKEKLRDVNSAAITKEELDGRYHQIESLYAQLLQLHTKFTNDTRNDLAASMVHEQTDNDVHLLKQEQIQILEEQNRGLETLSQTISRQRALASQLGQEVDDQNNILDNLATTMERVESRVNVETENIGFVTRRDNTFKYWIVIILLFIAIIIVGVN